MEKRKSAYKVFALFMLLIFSACINGSNNTIANESNTHFYYSVIGNGDEKYFEYIGELQVLKRKYKVINFFRRVHAAQFWHGQSRLLFISSSYTVTYILDSNSDFPLSIKNNQLYFPQKRIYYSIDSLSKILCIPGGCFEKDESIEHYNDLKIDSIEDVFKGKPL